MCAVQLISNKTKPDHREYLHECFASADEVWLATAFLKTSGINLLATQIKTHINNNKPIQIITGQNFGLTEPRALRALHDMFDKRISANIFLDKAEDKQKVFHPKLFIFRRGNTGIIVSGSANITNGGLIGNEEFSICVETPTSSTVWKEAVAYFNEITGPKKADLVSLVVINRYEQFYNEQKKIREKQKSAPDKKSSEHSFDYTKLKKRLKVYRNAGYLKDLNQRLNDYRKAKQLLDEIADSNQLSQNRFEQIIDTLVGQAGKPGLWRSGSLLRLRHEVYKCKKEFHALVAYIKDNQEFPATKVFIQAKKLVQHITGARMNYVTEIMMTYQPNRFANLNSNPIGVLDNEAGVYFKSHSDSFNGNDYEEYCKIIFEICERLNLKNMLEADSFFNEIYWKLKAEGKLK